MEMVRYFYGDDTFAAREAIGHLAEQEGAQIRWVDREQLQEQSIGDIVSRSTGLFGKDLIVVRDPSALPKSLQENIVAFLTEAASPVWVLWDREVPDKRTQLFKVLKKQAREFSALSPVELERWIQKQAESEGGSIAVPAAKTLVARVGSDRWRLLSELRRLLLQFETVTAEDVEREITAAAQAEIFSTLDALVGGNQARAIANIETLLEDGNSEFYVLSMLAYQFRTLLTIQAGMAEGLVAGAIAREGKLHPYVVEKSLPQVQHLRREVLLESLTRIMATDFAIKQGKVDPRTGLMMLVLTLSQSMRESAGSRV